MKNFILFLFIISSLQIFAQNPLSKGDKLLPGSQVANILKFPLISDISTNPALAGLFEKQHISFSCHSQWLNMENFPLSINNQFDMAAGKGKKYGAGIVINHYQFNTKEIYTIDLAFSVKFQLNKHNSLRWGISAVSFNKNIQNINRSGRIYEDMINPFLGIKYPTFERQHIYHENYFDLKTGIWLSHKSYFAGISVLHLYQISYGDENQVENIENLEPEALPVEIRLDGGYEFSLGNKLTVTPMVNVNGSFEQKMNISPSLNITYSQKILAGIEYHNMNIVAVNLGFRAFDHFNIIVTAGMPLKEELERISKFALFEAGISYIF